jgi:hypothetical protein
MKIIALVVWVVVALILLVVFRKDLHHDIVPVAIAIWPLSLLLIFFALSCGAISDLFGKFKKRFARAEVVQKTL